MRRHRPFGRRWALGTRRTVGALTVALLLASCSADGGATDAGGAESEQDRQAAPASSSPPTAGSSDGSGAPTGDASGSPHGASPTAAERPKPPPANACYDLGFRAATQPTNDSDPVPCNRRHTAQTYFVGQLDTVVDGHLLAVDSRRAQRQVSRTCPRRLARYLGGSDESRALSRLEAIWFSPTIAQSDRGATWFRCDVVALARPRTLATLPPPRRLRGILDDAEGLDRFGVCGTAPPDASGFERVICSRPHTWRALSTISIPGGPEYPGVESVREAGESTCRNRVREASGSPEEFTYGWEWPTRKQWRSGQRFGFCWAPD